MKIALVLYGTLDTLSGGYLYDRKLVAHLLQADHSIRVFSLPWRTYPAHLLDNLNRGWMQQIVDFRPDVILQDELNHPSLAFANQRLRALCPAPIVAIVHHLRCLEDHPWWLLPLYRYVERRYLASVDGFIWNSETTRRTVETLLGSGTLESALQGVVSYPSVGDWVGIGSASLHEGPIPNRPLRRLLFIGNLIPRKRLDVVLRALQNAPRHLTLDVVGSAESDPAHALAMRALAHNLQLGERVRFRGKVPNAQMAPILDASDLLVVPSFEGFGIVYLEAMAFGVPVVASQAGAAAEIVTEGENGFLVPPGNHAEITRMLYMLDNDPVLLQGLRTNARRTYERFPNWTQSGENSLAWLERLVSSHHESSK